MESVKIVFDIGGTKTRIAAVKEGTLGDAEIFETPLDPEEGIAALTAAIRTAVAGAPPAALCGGVKGVVKDGIVHNPPAIPKWDGLPLAARLQREFGASVTLMNDTELVGLGEYFYGAGKGERNMLYVTVSTGVGGVHIVDGVVDRGVYNAEIGHQSVDGKELEDLVSGSAVAKRYGIHPKDFDDAEILNELADTLARGLNDSVLHWSPEAIVLGGSMIVGKNPIPIDRVEKTLTKLVKERYPEAPRVLKAKLGDQGGLYGGMVCLNNQSFS